jgi:hypothetical protein
MAKGTKHLTDEEIIARLQKDAPEALEAKVTFDALIGRILFKPQPCNPKNAIRDLDDKDLKQPPESTSDETVFGVDQHVQCSM